MVGKSLAIAGVATLALLLCSPLALAQDNVKLLLTQPSSGTAKTLELTPQNDAQNVEAWYRPHRYYWPHAGFYYRPYAYSYYRPYYPSFYFSIGRPYYPAYYVAPPAYYYPAPLYFYYPVGLNGTIGSATSPAILRSGPSGVENLPLPTPVPGQPAPGTYPYDGGPANPVPPAKPENKPPNATMPLEGRTVSVPAPATSKYTYPAYGEERTPSNSPPDRTILIRK
jgi:hypothetical protein